MTRKLPLQKILQGVLQQKVKPNITMKGRQYQTTEKEKARK
jgi:hypothetical protein